VSCDRQHLLSAFPGPPTRVDSDFMSINTPEMYLIPACSYRRAQRRPGDGFKIDSAVVE